MALDCYLRPPGAGDRTRRILLPPAEAEHAAVQELDLARAVPDGAIWAVGPQARRLLPTDMGGQLIESRGLVLHVQEGDGDPWTWFDRPDVKGSSHWWVSRTGELVQYVPATRAAWTQAAGNASWHSVETEGYARDPLSQAQLATLGELYRWGAAWWGWAWALAASPSGRGLGTHEMGGVAWGGHACPGPVRAGQRAVVLALAQRQAPPQTEEDDVDEADLRAVLNEGTGAGQTGWAGTSRATLAAAQEAVNAGRAAKEAAAQAAATVARIERAVTGAPLSVPDVLAAVQRATAADLGHLASIGVAVATQMSLLLPPVPSSPPPPEVVS